MTEYILKPQTSGFLVVVCEAPRPDRATLSECYTHAFTTLSEALDFIKKQIEGEK